MKISEYIVHSLLVLRALGSGSALTSAKSCQDYSIPVTITSENYIFGPRFRDNFDLIDFVTDLNSRTASTSFNPYVGHENQTGSYTISATFCTPRGQNAPKKDIVLLLSHGLNFDRTYWNPGIHPEKYSFVDYAIGRGYSTFFYDRLGVGKSSRISGYVAQGSNQVAILQFLAHSIRSGQYTGSIGAPKSLVLVGHSFGSGISAAAITLEPDLADGVVLTGFNFAPPQPLEFPEAAGLRIAATQQPGKWRQLDNGYVTLVDIYSNINTFFKQPDYDVSVAKFADANKQPIAINEIVSLGLLNVSAVNFPGVAMIIAGQYDFIFCDSQCDGILEPLAAKVFSNARAFKAVSYPNSGHGLSFALNAQGSFDEIISFLENNGL